MFDVDNKESVVTFKIDGYSPLWIEQDLVVLRQGYVFGISNFGRDCHDSAGYRRNFDIIRQTDTAFGLFLVLILSNQDPAAYRLNRFKR